MRGITTFQIGVRISYRLWEVTKEYARARGLKPSRVVEEALREYLEKRGVVVEEPEVEERYPMSSIHIRLKEEEAELLAVLAKRKKRSRTELVREGMYLLFEKVKREIEEERARKAKTS